MLEADDADSGRGGRLGRFIRNVEYLYKWLLLGIIIGVVAGLGAVGFYLALRYTTHFLLGYVAGYHLPSPLVEGGSPGSPQYQRPWAKAFGAGRECQPGHSARMSWTGSRAPRRGS